MWFYDWRKILIYEDKKKMKEKMNQKSVLKFAMEIVKYIWIQLVVSFGIASIIWNSYDNKLYPDKMYIKKAQWLKLYIFLVESFFNKNLPFVLKIKQWLFVTWFTIRNHFCQIICDMIYENSHC